MCCVGWLCAVQVSYVTHGVWRGCVRGASETGWEHFSENCSHFLHAMTVARHKKLPGLDTHKTHYSRMVPAMPARTSNFVLVPYI